MSNDFSQTDADRRHRTTGTGSRGVTGWMVLALLVAFFAVVFGVNAFMVHEALSTFGGVETDSSYQAGQTFEHDVAMAKAQDARHWRVDAKVTRRRRRRRAARHRRRDASGAPLAGMTATRDVRAPDRPAARSQPSRCSEDAPGHFTAAPIIAAGQWDLVIELSRQGERMFRSQESRCDCGERPAMAETLDLSMFVERGRCRRVAYDAGGRRRRLRRLHPQDRGRAQPSCPGVIDARLNFTQRRLAVDWRNGEIDAGAHHQGARGHRLSRPSVRAGTRRGRRERARPNGC